MPSGRSTPVKAAISRKPGAAQNRATYDYQTSRVFARFAGHVIYYTVRCGVDLRGAMPRQDSLLENGLSLRSEHGLGGEGIWIQVGGSGRRVSVSAGQSARQRIRP